MEAGPAAWRSRGGEGIHTAGWLAPPSRESPAGPRPCRRRCPADCSVSRVCPGADVLTAFAWGPEAGEAAHEPSQSGFSGWTIALPVLLLTSPSLSWNTMGSPFYFGGASFGSQLGPCSRGHCCRAPHQAPPHPTSPSALLAQRNPTHPFCKRVCLRLSMTPQNKKENVLKERVGCPLPLGCEFCWYSKPDAAGHLSPGQTPGLGCPV